MKFFKSEHYKCVDFIKDNFSLTQLVAFKDDDDDVELTTYIISSSKENYGISRG